MVFHCTVCKRSSISPPLSDIWLKSFKSRTHTTANRFRFDDFELKNENTLNEGVI